jgi:hypothetical protein
VQCIKHFQEVESELHKTEGEVAVKISAKLQRVLQRNRRYSTLFTISDILCGTEVELENSELELEGSNLTCFMYAPVTSCDVQRNFSNTRPLLMTIAGFSNSRILKWMLSSSATLLKRKFKVTSKFSTCTY